MDKIRRPSEEMGMRVLAAEGGVEGVAAAQKTLLGITVEAIPGYWTNDGGGTRWRMTAP